MKIKEGQINTCFTNTCIIIMYGNLQLSIIYFKDNHFLLSFYSTKNAFDTEHIKYVDKYMILCICNEKYCNMP